MTDSAKRSAIITGASGGLGGFVAKRLVKDGFAVAVHYAGKAAPAQAMVAELNAAGGQAIRGRLPSFIQRPHHPSGHPKPSSSVYSSVPCGLAVSPLKSRRLVEMDGSLKKSCRVQRNSVAALLASEGLGHLQQKSFRFPNL